MKQVKITILKTNFHKDLVQEFAEDGLSICPVLEEGQVFYTYHEKPDDFCEGAWKSIERYVHELAEGVGDDWYSKDWMKKPGVAIVSCSDGLRPVIMKVEATHIESKTEKKR